MYKDSVDKIMMYISSLIKGECVIDGVLYKEKKIVVSSLILREIKCVAKCGAKCGACCNLSFTLDYLPNEKLDNCVKRTKFGKEIYTIFPKSKDEKRCQYLNMNNGYCDIHDVNPFTCDFEMIRFKQYESKNTVLIGTFPYGRCWNMLKYTGERGGLCVKSGYSEQYKKDVIRKLNRLKDWIDYFGILTYIDDLIKLVENMNSCEGKAVVLNKGFLI